MNRRFRPLLCAAVVIVAGTAAAVAQTPVDTGWTYQGRLTDGGSPATGTYDLRFSLFADDAGTLPVGDPLAVDGVEVTEGLFTTRLDFGAAFAGEKRWLQIEVSPAGQASYTALPLQEISSAPQALFSMLPWGTNGPSTYFLGAGGVGVGTSAPVSRLHLYADESVNCLVETGGGTNAWARTSYRTQNGQWDIGTSQEYNGDQLYFYRAGAATTAMNIAPNGNVGIGPSGALAKLHLYDDNSVAQRIETGGATNAWSRTEYRNGNGAWYIGTSRGFNGDQFYVYREGAPTVAFAVLPNGTTEVRTLRILGGSDLAEPFDVAAPASGAVEAGMVVVIDENHPGDLRLADQPYDGKVAGVISGANGLAPGMVMKAEGAEHADGQHPVAMTGRVWCYVDASFGAVAPGDRLTTSSTPGHAMKASDGARAGGAVIGKAMTGLTEGKGLVLVLVNLQ